MACLLHMNFSQYEACRWSQKSQNLKNRLLSSCAECCPTRHIGGSLSCSCLLLSCLQLNHFPGSFQIGRKDRLWRNVSRMQMRFGKKEFNFLPQSFILPQDVKLLRKAWEDCGSRQKWIVKPVRAQRRWFDRNVDRGIFLEISVLVPHPDYSCNPNSHICFPLATVQAPLLQLDIFHMYSGFFLISH